MFMKSRPLLYSNPLYKNGKDSLDIQQWWTKHQGFRHGARLHTGYQAKLESEFDIRPEPGYPAKYPIFTTIINPLAFG